MKKKTKGTCTKCGKKNVKGRYIGYVFPQTKGDISIIFHCKECDNKNNN